MTPGSEPLCHSAQGTVKVKGGAVEIPIELETCSSGRVFSSIHGVLGSMDSTTQARYSGSHLEPQLSGNRDRMTEVILRHTASLRPT